MKIQVDDSGWAVVSEAKDETVRPSSGVFPKTTDEASGAEAATDVSALVEARTEPAASSEEAIQISVAPLPPLSALPADLLALAAGGSKVA